MINAHKHSECGQQYIPNYLMYTWCSSSRQQLGTAFKQIFFGSTRLFRLFLHKTGWQLFSLAKNVRILLYKNTQTRKEKEVSKFWVLNPDYSLVSILIFGFQFKAIINFQLISSLLLLFNRYPFDDDIDTKNVTLFFYLKQVDKNIFISQFITNLWQ